MTAVELQGKALAKQAPKAAAAKSTVSKPKKKSGQKKPIASKAEKLPASLDKKAELLAVKLTALRGKIVENESILAKKIAEKMKAEDELNKLLMKNFSEEKAVLSMVKKGAARKQAGLEQKIASLKSIEKVYNEKKGRIAEAKKRQAALKKQLQLLEKKVGP